MYLSVFNWTQNHENFYNLHARIILNYYYLHMSLDHITCHICILIVSIGLSIHLFIYVLIFDYYLHVCLVHTTCHTFIYFYVSNWLSIYLCIYVLYTHTSPSVSINLAFLWAGWTPAIGRKKKTRQNKPSRLSVPGPFTPLSVSQQGAMYMYISHTRPLFSCHFNNHNFIQAFLYVDIILLLYKVQCTYIYIFPTYYT